MKFKSLCSIVSLLCASSFVCNTIQAQNVGINVTNPDASSILDITHTTRGLLIPRVQLVASNNPAPITAPTLSLLVFNLLPVGVFPNDVKTGYYYWNGAKWVGIGTGNAWELIGNSGTSAGVNFIGTIDAQDLVLKTNSIENMRILNSNGNVGIGTNSPTFKLDLLTSASSESAAQFTTTGNVNVQLKGGTGLHQFFRFFENNTGRWEIGNSSADNNKFYFNTAVGAGNLGAQMVIQQNGNVGIGTNAPLDKLMITGGRINAVGTSLLDGRIRLERTDAGGNPWDIYSTTLANNAVPDGSLNFFNATTSKSALTLANNSNVGINNSSPAPSAQLDVTSTTSGFAMPRMTSAQRKAIASPIAGLEVYDITLKGQYTFDGTKWDCSNNPAGSVNYFANATAPNGYLECNGQAVNTTTYAELFAAIGYLYGGGGASFNVPDLRGEFVRGVDKGRGVDVGRVIGTGQIDDFKSHTHQLPSEAGGGAFVEVTIGLNSGFDIGLNSTYPTGGIETRPRNVAMLPCIKF